eukprot:CAMPEP_0179001560 /NCGR_PEP_ID=MMETSP0795-20121207/11440_1 /TAXON_ID=88552 /ORGANISM="Amoebophrya sp., Strain Ameob2" /LENGTH=188 /DNA_ID=CAMNT_0020694971 /DNA_START=39 /DNA_END=602 /DNA_ORIENTATION=+
MQQKMALKPTWLIEYLAFQYKLRRQEMGSKTDNMYADRQDNSDAEMRITDDETELIEQRKKHIRDELSAAMEKDELFEEGNKNSPGAGGRSKSDQHGPPSPSGAGNKSPKNGKGGSKKGGEEDGGTGRGVEGAGNPSSPRRTKSPSPQKNGDVSHGAAVEGHHEASSPSQSPTSRNRKAGDGGSPSGR